MAKKLVKLIKLQIPAGKANPAPPIGPALGAAGVNIMGFCKEFNERTKGKEGLILPAIITVYKDKSFEFVIKSAPSTVLIKKAANLAKASGTTGTEIIATLKRAQIQEIAKQKMEDLNTPDMAVAVKVIEGTARSMGIKVVD